MRLQRVYTDTSGAAHLGNDWARGHHHHHPHTHCSETHTDTQQQTNTHLQQQQQQRSSHYWQQQQQQLETQHVSVKAVADGVRGSRLHSWWAALRQVLLSTLLPSPGLAAAAADFAVGDEALANLPTHTVAAAAANRPFPASPAAPSPADEVDNTATSTAAAAGDDDVWGPSLPPSASLSTYRKLKVALGNTDLPRAASAAQQTSKKNTLTTAAASSSSSNVGRCRSSSAFVELQYDVFNLQDYDPVWEHYAYIHPVWVGDFGKYNLSASSNMSESAKVSTCCCCGGGPM